jgi:hypothetical protein
MISIPQIHASFCRLALTCGDDGSPHWSMMYGTGFDASKISFNLASDNSNSILTLLSFRAVRFLKLKPGP